MDGFKPHSARFRLRRFANWFPLGLAYAFLYMGRYNLTVAKNALGDVMSKADFADIFSVGAVVYGVSFVVNGPLTDRIGGRRTMLIGMVGAILANVGMGCVLYGRVYWDWQFPLVGAFTALYALNMYFQSFGAVAIVTVKAPWFYVRERGTFSTIFGIMISAGIYFAFDWGEAIVRATRATPQTDIGMVAAAAQTIFGIGAAGVNQDWWLFFIPSIILTGLWVVLFLFLRDTPRAAGFDDFDTGEETMSQDGQRLPVTVIFFKILQHPVLLTICVIEFCSGVMRNGVMHWYTFFAKETGIFSTFFVTRNWGLVQLMAGVLGAFLTGWASDRFFGSRRGPMAAILYTVMFAGAVTMSLTLAAAPWFMGLSVVLIIVSVIGVHGIMSGTSTADFGGTKNAGAAVGVVDGLVYLGTALQSKAAGSMTPTGLAAKDPANWVAWPMFLVPFALIGLVASVRIWNAMPKKRVAPITQSEGSATAPAIAE